MLGSSIKGSNHPIIIVGQIPWVNISTLFAVRYVLVKFYAQSIYIFVVTVVAIYNVGFVKEKLKVKS